MKTRQPKLTFRRLCEAAKTSPVYWMYGLELEFDERLVRYKKRYAAATDLTKKKMLGAKMAGLKECLYAVKRELKRHRNEAIEKALKND